LKKDDKFNKLSEELKKDDKLNKLFYDIEIPLLTVLKKMELKGVRVNNEELLMMSKEIGLFLEKQSEKIQELAGCRFNVDSPFMVRRGRAVFILLTARCWKN